MPICPRLPCLPRRPGRISHFFLLALLLALSLRAVAVPLTVDYRCDGADPFATARGTQPAAGHEWQAVVDGRIPLQREVNHCWVRISPQHTQSAPITERWLSVTDLNVNPTDLVLFDARGNPIARANRLGQSENALVTGRRALFMPPATPAGTLYVRLSPAPGSVAYPGFDKRLQFETVAPDTVLRQEQRFDLTSLAISLFVLTTAIASAFLYARLREPGFGLYALYGFAHALASFSRTGLPFIADGHAAWLLNASTFHYLFGALLMELSSHIGSFARHQPRLAMLCRGIAIGFLVTIPLQYLSPALTEKWVLILLPGQLLVLLGGNWIAWRRGEAACGILLAGLLPIVTYWLIYLIYNIALQLPMPSSLAVGSGFDHLRTLALPIALCIALADKAARLQLRAREESRSLRTVFDTIPDIVYLKDRDSVYLQANRAFAHMVGKPLESIAGSTDLDFFSAETAAELRIEDLQVLKDGRRWQAIKERKLPSGEIRYFNSHKLPFLDADGKVIGILGNVRDVTEQVKTDAERAKLAADLAQARLTQARIELRQADDRATQMMQALDDAVIGLNAEHRIISLNPAAERLLGYSMEEASGQRFHMLAHHTRSDGTPCDEDQCVPLMLHMRAHQAISGTDQFWRRNATSFVGEFSYQPLITDGKPQGAVMVIRDVTEQQTAEKRLLFLSRAVEDSPAAVMMTDTRGLVTYVNPRFEALYGYPREEIINQPSDRILSTRLSEQQFASITQHLRLGEEWMGELEGRHRNGQTLWTRTHLSALRDAEGNVTHYLMLAEDTTLNTILEMRERAARRETDAAHHRLAEQEQFLRLIAENLPARILYVDHNERITFCNRLAGQLIGRSPDEVIGYQSAEVFHPDVYALIQPYYRKALQGETVTYTHALPDGRVLETVLIADRGDGGSVRGVIGMSLDITEKLRNAEALQQAITTAERANRAKSEFLANMSHEIRTPMQAILGLTTLMQQTELDGKLVGFVRKMDRSARLLLSVVNDILDFSKIEAGKLALESRPFSLDEIVEKLADLFSDAADEKGVELVIDVMPGTPDRLIGDSLRLTQVLANLCSNAIKFTQRGEVLIRISATETTATRALIEFSVTDTGIGMTAAQADTVFNAFAQGDGSTTRRFGGTGLGLAICRDLVALMGGRIEVQSNPGQGSCFYFSIHLARPADDAGAAAAPQGQSALLWIQSINRHAALVHRLQQLGIATLDAADAEDVLRILQPASPDDTRPAWILTDARTESFAALQTRLAERFINPPRLIRVAQRPVPGGSPADDIASSLTGPITRERLLHALENPSRSPASTPLIPLSRRSGLSGAHILLVDDNAMNHEIISAYLDNMDCRLSHAMDGQEALEVLAADSADAVLMDCQMPVMDGYEATRLLRLNAQFRTLPIIALTANATEEEKEKCLAIGMNDFLAKPVLVEDLIDALIRHIHHEPPAAHVSDAGEKPAPSMSLQEEFSALSGIDLAAALRTAMGNPSLFKRMLSLFYDTHASFVTQFREVGANGDEETTLRMAHSLKSDAASIGAIRLKQAALELEKTCRAHANEAAIDAALNETVAELNPVLAGIQIQLAPAN